MLCTGFHAIHSRTRTTAGAIVKALYAALDSTKQCQHLCRGSIFLPPHAGMWGPEKRQMGPNQVAINTAITAFNTDSADQLTAQLNTIACLARICEQEQKHVDDASWRQVHAPETKPWYRYAIEQKTFRRAMDSFATAFKVPDAHHAQLTACLYMCVAMSWYSQSCSGIPMQHSAAHNLLHNLQGISARHISLCPQCAHNMDVDHRCAQVALLMSDAVLNRTTDNKTSNVSGCRSWSAMCFYTYTFNHACRRQHHGPQSAAWH